MNRRSDTGKLSLKIPSDIRYVKEVSSGILKWLKPRNLDDSAIFDIRLCVEEVVRNAIVHGNNNDKGLKVLIIYWLEGDHLIVEVEDEGGGFDSGKVSDPTIDENRMKLGGRGVYLVRHLMDEVKFNDKGNKVRLVKYLK
ncbi:MAG: ATP-binding protein [Candidatus Omnitrophota bacterium]|jgi:serine/threonine-protein kinase RsbW|nr:ATP-binding protein [Candidatus Omnitrophota bacterium]